MTTTTTPDNLVIWTVSDPDALSTASAAMQTSVQAAFTSRFAAQQIKTYKWPNAAARAAQTGMTAGDTGYQQDTKANYQYDGTTWVGVSTATLTPAAGITIVAQSLTKQNGMIILNLRVSGTIFSGTLLTTLPLGFRPVAAWLPGASALVGSTPYAAAAQIMPTGEVYGYSASSASYLFGISCIYVGA